MYPFVQSCAAYLRSVVESKAGRALNIVISAVSERVVRANNDLVHLISSNLSVFVIVCHPLVGCYQAASP
jgi:hypothetical protein